MTPDKATGLAEISSLLENHVPCASSVSCSVCLEVVNDLGERSIARLKCGHRFHLDCIGSAFNAKGRMQCPNCRQVEHGQWLYANGCCLHEDLVQELTNDDDYEAYGGMIELDHGYDEMQSGHMPWCPYQGSYPYFPLPLEEFHSSGNEYSDVTMNIRQSGRAPMTGHICPYLATEGFRMAGSSHIVENLVNLQIGHALRTSNNRRSIAFSSAERNHWAYQALMPSETSSMLAAHESGVHNFTSRERVRLVQSSPNSPQGAEAFHWSSLSAHPGHQRPNYSGGFALGPVGTHHSQNRGHEPISANSAAHNGYVWTSRARQRSFGQVPSQRVVGFSSTEQPWVRNHSNWGSMEAIGPNLNFGDGVSWGADGLVDSWTRGVAFTSQGLYGTPHHWWAWVPPGGNSTQNVMPNSFTSSYYENQFYGGNGPFLRPNSPSHTQFGRQDGSGFLWPNSGFH